MCLLNLSLNLLEAKAKKKNFNKTNFTGVQHSSYQEQRKLHLRGNYNAINYDFNQHSQRPTKSDEYISL